MRCIWSIVLLSSLAVSFWTSDKRAIGDKVYIAERYLAVQLATSVDPFNNGS